MNAPILRCNLKNTPKIPLESTGKVLFNAIKTHPSNKKALIDVKSGEFYTFGDIVNHVINLTNQLRCLNIQKNDIIALSSQNNREYFIINLAALCIGAPIHLLNPTYTPYELKNVLELTKPKLIFCTKISLNNVRETAKTINSIKNIVLIDNNETYLDDDVINFKNLLKTIDMEFKIEQDFNVNDQVAIIVNSSGTTGIPKAALITHASCCLEGSYIDIPDIHNYTADDSAIVLLPLYHVYGWGCQRTFLYVGCTSFIFDQFDPFLYLSIIEKEKIKCLFVVPSLLTFLATTPLTDKYNLTSVNNMFNGAAAPNNDILDIICKKFNLNFVKQMYGSTETVGLFSTFYLNDQNRKGSSGRLLPHRELKVIDLKNGDILGANSIGELYVRGGIFKGYSNNEKETKESIDKDGFFATGDVGYYDDDGYIYILDRLKDLIKYKAYQVPPLEIEEVLLKHPAVRDAAVVGKPDINVGELPMAFIVKNNGFNNVEEKELIDFVAQYLCEYKQLHGGVRFIDEIPKNSIGKTLKRNLRDLL